MAKSHQTFGDLLRATRVAKGYSLRKFAQLADMSPTYLSQVEQGKIARPPTADRVQRMAELLGANVDGWIALAGRVSKEMEEILHSQPERMPALLRAARGLSAEQLRQLTEEAERKKQSGGSR